jgi:hypothetical protein
MLKWSAATNRTITSSADTLASLNYPLLFEPGTDWVYGTGNDWAGRVVEVLTKLTLEDYMQQHIFAPLGMSSTTFFIANHPDLARRRAEIAFRPKPRQPLQAGPDPAPLAPAMAKGGSGLFTTANDYSRLLHAVLSHDTRILTPASVEELFRPQLADAVAHFQAACDGPMHDALCPEFARGEPVNYGLGGAVNLGDLAGRRKGGSMMWSGVSNPRWVSIRRGFFLRESRRADFLSSLLIRSRGLRRRCLLRCCRLGMRWWLICMGSLRRRFIRRWAKNSSLVFENGNRMNRKRLRIRCLRKRFSHKLHIKTLSTILALAVA